MILRTRAIWAGKGRIIGDAALRIRGDRIAGLDASRNLFPEPGEPVVDIGESIIFPAFINAHCHLDYTGLGGELFKGESFTTWLNNMVAIKRSLTHSDYESGWLAGANMLLSSGCGTVANIESVPGLFQRMALKTPLQVCPFTELIGYHSEDSDELVNLAKRELAVNTSIALRAGLSPHAPYTLTSEALSLISAVADERSVPTMVHLAESEDELEMFMKASGPMYEAMNDLGRKMEDCGLGSPVQHFANSGGFSQKTLVVHANKLIGADVGFLQRANVDIIHCPRSRDWFGHQGFDYDRFANAGLNISIGTDSLASAGGGGGVFKLDMFTEMREFKRCHPRIDCEDILQLATLNGAKALGLEREIGQLRDGGRADLASIPFSGKMPEVPEMILHHQGSVEMTMIAGKKAYSRFGSIVD